MSLVRFMVAVSVLGAGCAGDGTSTTSSLSAGHAQALLPGGSPHRPACPPPARRTMSGRGTAIVDGVIGTGEWRHAASAPFQAHLPGGGTAPAELFVMNDDSNLYVAVRIARMVVDPGNSLGLEFDNDDDCARANGDDAVVMNPAVGLVDDFRTSAAPCPPGSATAACGLRDVDAAGRNDGRGAFAHRDGFTIYELSHPLRSGDTGRDIDLRVGGAVGMYLVLRMIDGAGQIGDTAFPSDGFLAIKTRPALGPCVPSAGPRPLQWADGRYFPSFPRAQHLFVLPAVTQLHDHDAWQSDWRISDSYETMNALTLVGMQGVINRDTPCVYLDWFDPLTGASAFWLSRLGQDVTLDRVDVEGIAAIDFLYRGFAGRFTGAVIYDPEIPDTINLATMIAGLENRIILSPQQLALPGVPALADITDLRVLAAAQGWDATEDGKHQLYQWVYDHLWPRLEHRFVGVVSPGPPTSRAIPGSANHHHPLTMAGRDYVIALRAPALWLSPLDAPDSALFDRFLDSAPPAIPVSGWFGNDEDGTVALASRHDDWVPGIHVASAPLSSGNLTALAGAREPIARFAAAIDPERILATLGDAPVTTLFSSDGSVQHQSDRGTWGPIGFPWSEVQGHRFAWTTNPTLVDLAPALWNYYVESADQVTLIDSLSGTGNAYPQQMSGAGLKTYLQRTSDYNRRTGIRVVQIDTRKGPYETIAPEVHAQLKRSGYLGAFAGGGFPVLGLPAVYAGVPSPGVAAAYVVPSLPSAEAVLADLPGRRLGNFTFRLFDWPSLLGGAGTVIADPTAPSGKAVQYLATLARCCAAFSTTPQRLLPGTYSVTFHLKVADNRAPENMATIYAGIAGQADPLARRVINASDFAQSGQWQTFSFSFSLSAQTAGVQLQLDFLPGVSDLFASQMRVVRDGVDPLPVFAPILISLTAPGPKRELARLGEQLQAAGVVVLSADEFMAALNPEYMIGFAAPRMGANHPALRLARAQLKAGQFFEALVTVRTALAASRR